MIFFTFSKFAVLFLIINITQLSALPAARGLRGGFSFALPSGRVLRQDHLPSRLRHLSKQELSNSLHELTECHLHSPQSSIDLCARPYESHEILPLSASTARIDGVPLPTDKDYTISLTTHLIDSHRVTVARNVLGVPVIAWMDGTTLYPFNSKMFPGVLIKSAHGPNHNNNILSNRKVTLDDDAIPIPTVPDAHHANDSFPTALSATEACRKGGPPRQVEVAVAFDAEYCNVYSLNGEEATQSLRALVAEAGKAFSDDTCIRLKVVSFDGVCNPGKDPYSQIGSDPLEMFRQYWISNMGSVKRDIAYFVSGAEDGTSTAGRAYLRATCNDAYGYGWAEGNSPAIFAHEMGHTLGADHAESGLMRPSLTGNDPLKFSAETLQQIFSFVNDGGASSECLTSTSGGGQSNPPPPSSPTPSESPSFSPSASQSETSMPSLTPSTIVSSTPSPTNTAQKSVAPSRSVPPMPSSIGPKPSKSPKVSKSPRPSSSPLPSESPILKMSSNPDPTMKPARSPKTSAPPPRKSTPAKPMPEISNSPDEPLSSPVPSDSPEPSMFLELLPTPSQPTTDDLDTCETSLRRMGQPMPCTHWEELGSLGTRMGSVSVRLRQVHGRFRLLVQPLSNSEMAGVMKITSMTALFSFLTERSGAESFVKRSFNKAGTRAQVNVHPRFLKLPEGLHCCGATLYINVTIAVQRNIPFGSWNYEGTSEAGGVYAFRVKCRPDCKNRNHSSFGDDCPVCA